jgi:hypothetical protein
MSYCRFGEADVYVFMHVNGRLCCCGCSYHQDDDEPFFYADSTDAMIEHLKRHRADGHDVPERVFEDLRADDGENFPGETCKRSESENERENSTK